LRQLDLHGPAGRLEALLEEVPGARFAALVCHPHPQLGGTMHNHATYRLARAVRSAGGTSLRFNFRGAGRSAGSHDQGRGEADDARAALSELRAIAPAAPVLCCGFSFGAWIAVAVGAEDPGVAGLLVAGLPVRPGELLSLRAPERVRSIGRPLAVVQAERDQFGTPAEVTELLAGSAGPRHLVAVPGASHLFTEDLAGLERAAGEAVEWVLGKVG
jgi:hypothetical protein